MHSESRTRVRYKETDQMGIAHHSNYLVWFEIGRTDLCRMAAESYRAIEERGYLLVVTEIGCRYRTPFRYDEEVIIHTRVGECGSRMIRFDYELKNLSGEVCATGFTRHVWLDGESRQPRTAPSDLLEIFHRMKDS